MSRIQPPRPTSIAAAVSVADGAAQHIERLRSRGYAANTLLAYSTDLRQFDAYLHDRGDGTLVALLTNRHVSGWLDAMSAAGISRRSQARKLAALRRFIAHARAEGWIGHDPTQGEDVRWRARRVIAPEMDVLRGFVDSITGNSVVDVRDRAMLRLALDAALRISDARTLDIAGVGSESHVDLSRRLVHVVGKGNQLWTVGINDRTAAQLEAWLQRRHELAAPGEHALFVSERGRRYSRVGLDAVLRRRAAAAGLDDMHWHLLRHRRIEDVYSRVGPAAAQEHARHLHRATTENVYGRHADTVTRSMIRTHADLDAAPARRAA